MGKHIFLIVSTVLIKKQADNMRSSATGVVSGSTVNATQVRNISIRKHTVHAIYRYGRMKNRNMLTILDV